jgi:hypothetical protein
VMKVPLSGGTPVTLASSQLPGTIAVDGTSVYWSASDPTFNGWDIVKVGLSGGTPLVLVSGLREPAWEIFVDSTNVYWTLFNVETISKVGLSGGTPMTIATGVSAFASAIDSTSIYWTEHATGSVQKVGLYGGDPVTLALLQVPSLGIAVDSAAVYWTVQNEHNWDGCDTAACQTGLLQKTGLAAGTVVTLASGPSPRAIAVDSTSVYWTDTSAGTVMKAPK